MEQDILTTNIAPLIRLWPSMTEPLRLKMWPRGLKGIGLVPRPRCA